MYVVGIGVGKLGVVDVYVYVDGVDGVFGGFQVDVVDIVGQFFIVEIGFVVVFVYEWMEYVVGLVEVILVVQCDWLLFDGVQMCVIGIVYVVVEFVGGVLQFYGLVVVDVVVEVQCGGWVVIYFVYVVEWVVFWLQQ